MKYLETSSGGFPRFKRKVHEPNGNWFRSEWKWRQYTIKVSNYPSAAAWSTLETEYTVYKGKTRLGAVVSTGTTSMQTLKARLLELLEL